MPTHADTLRSIKTFPDLVRYLEDELDWPLQEYGFDELTFEYSPAELGLRDEDAAKVKAIHQLRPMADGQPFGIFFVEFERKRMPVVVLRRILSHLALKQRASANRAGSAAWALGDLLFISAFGDEASDQREIAFAHFRQEAGDLPTLRVLGWDGADAGLKLDYVVAVLHERLCWPADPADADAWRQQWVGAFRHRLGHVIRTSDALAERLAELARGIRGAAITLMAHESERGPLLQLHKAFQTTLIHDLTEAAFADTYAQTVTYGLLTAAIQRTDLQGGRHDTTLYSDMLAEVVPITNPFLREMLQTFLHIGGRQGGINFDELGIQDVVDLLRGDETDLPAILRDFGNRTRGEDPVIHFYEHFLAAYDKKLKVQRGIFYTPQPVVSYIVRSVHELLQSEFGLADGLASTVTWGEMRQTFTRQTFEVSETSKVFAIPEGTDPASPFVTILDPATGTATFLVEVIEVIYRHLRAKWDSPERKQLPGLSTFNLHPSSFADYWNDYVPRHLLPRLHGYELMMAPYAIAHMKIGLKLHETGYRFGSVERVRVYLTNALEPPDDERGQLAFAGWAPALAHEAQAVNAIKRWQRFTVVIGNPPYSKLSQNRIPAIDTLMERYKVTVRVEEIQRQALSNDYVKFVCLATDVLQRSFSYVLGLITDNSYLDGPLFRDMRADLLKTFRTLRIVDLKGNSRKRSATMVDENVFDIQQGVSICLGSTSPMSPRSFCAYTEVMGERKHKQDWLMLHSSASAGYTELSPSPPNYYLLPRSAEKMPEWDSAIAVPDLFAGGRRAGRPLSFNGAAMATRHDELAIAFTKAELVAKLRVFFDSTMSYADLTALYRLCRSSHFDFDRARTEVTPGEAIESIQPILYRPFDFRYVVYHHLLIGEPRPDVMHHLLRANLALLTTRRVTGKPFDNVFITSGLVEYKAATHDRNTQVFPLYLYKEDARPGSQLLWYDNEASRSPNFDSTTYKRCCTDYGVTRPEQVLNYVYALLFSPTYRLRYQQELEQDYARLVFPDSSTLYWCLERLGGELVALHLMESPALARHITTYTGPAAPTVEKVSYAGGAVWLDKAQTAGFRGVPEAVWSFHIGGYQVCEKWLKDRKGRTLSAEEIEHYQRVVVALHETIRVMGEIDAVIEEHGGWPIR